MKRQLEETEAKIDGISKKIDITNTNLQAEQDNLWEEIVLTQYLRIEVFLVTIDNVEKRNAMAGRMEKFMHRLRSGGKDS